MKFLKENKEKKLIYKMHNLKIQQFLTLRAHVGHYDRILNKKMNSLVLGISQKNVMLDNFKILWSWEIISQILTKTFMYRQKFFILSPNKNLPNKWIQKLLDWEFFSKSSYLPYYLGYMSHSWNGGILSNWSKLWSFIISVFKKIVSGKHISKLEYTLLKKMSARISKGGQATFPDFLFALSADEALLHEAYLTRIISLSLIDSDKNPLHSSLTIFGNDDSILLIEMFFQLIEESYLNSSREEQELFYKIFLIKLKKLLY
jgi:ribosomal protein S2